MALRIQLKSVGSLYLNCISEEDELGFICRRSVWASKPCWTHKLLASYRVQCRLVAGFTESSTWNLLVCFCDYVLSLLAAYWSPLPYFVLVWARRGWLSTTFSNTAQTRRLESKIASKCYSLPTIYLSSSLFQQATVPMRAVFTEILLQHDIFILYRAT